MDSEDQFGTGPMISTRDENAAPPCTLKIISGLASETDFFETLKQLTSQGTGWTNERVYRTPDCGYILFITQSGMGEQKGNYGEKFADYLRRQDIGEVTEIGPNRNARHGKDKANLWVWKVDHDKTQAWFETKGLVESEEAIKAREEAIAAEQARKDAARQTMIENLRKMQALQDAKPAEATQ
jgi:hypothetical protein